MGWWSETVLGGDEPLDYLADMEVIMGFTTDNEEHELTLTQRRATIEKGMAELIKYAEKVGSEISWHVLGAIIITNGAKMSGSVRKQIIRAIKEDEWARENKVRRAYMRKFLRQIKNYPLNKNTRSRKLPYEGLFDKIFEKLAEADNEDSETDG